MSQDAFEFELTRTEQQIEHFFFFPRKAKVTSTNVRILILSIIAKDETINLCRLSLLFGDTQS